jgi:basic membrane protein A
VQPGVHSFDLASGGVELLLCPQVAGRIPDDVKAKVEELRQGVISGAIAIADE